MSDVDLSRRVNPSEGLVPAEEDAAIEDWFDSWARQRDSHGDAEVDRVLQETGEYFED